MIVNIRQLGKPGKLIKIYWKKKHLENKYIKKNLIYLGMKTEKNKNTELSKETNEWNRKTKHKTKQKYKKKQTNEK